jgi:hypothetical protein
VNNPRRRADPDLTSVLRVLPQLAADDVDRLIDVFRRDNPWLGTARVFLADYQEVLLRELVSGADLSTSVHRPGGAPIAGTLAGRAFVSQQPVADPAGSVWWLPLTNRWRRIGVISVSLTTTRRTPSSTPAAACRRFWPR